MDKVREAGQQRFPLHALHARSHVVRDEDGADGALPLPSLPNQVVPNTKTVAPPPPLDSNTPSHKSSER